MCGLPCISVTASLSLKIFVVMLAGLQYKIFKVFIFNLLCYCSCKKQGKKQKRNNRCTEHGTAHNQLCKIRNHSVEILRMSVTLSRFFEFITFVIKNEYLVLQKAISVQIISEIVVCRKFILRVNPFSDFFIYQLAKKYMYFW